MFRSNLFHITSCRVEKKAEYRITVVTGNKEGAGIDASAFLVIKGTDILLLVFAIKNQNQNRLIDKVHYLGNGRK